MRRPGAAFLNSWKQLGVCNERAGRRSRQLPLGMRERVPQAPTNRITLGYEKPAPEPPPGSPGELLGVMREQAPAASAYSTIATGTPGYTSSRTLRGTRTAFTTMTAWMALQGSWGPSRMS